jgi:PAS domain S-box-containing protein
MDPSKNATLIESVLLIGFVAFLIAIRSQYHLLFHTSAEFFACLVSFGLFLTMLNISGIRENPFIVFLSIGYFFIANLDMMHIFVYPGVSIIFENGSQSIVVQFWIAARYLTALTVLGSTLILLGKFKGVRFNRIFCIYAVICVFIVLSILYFKNFPKCYIIGQGLTLFKIYSEYIITAVFVLVAVIYFMRRRNMDKRLFFYMESHLGSLIVTELLFTSFFSPYDWTNIWAHIIRVLSYYFLYKAIIETALKRPYAVLYQEIDEIDKKLHQTNKKLLQEQKQRSLMEQALIKNEKCYELIINNSSDAIVVISEGVIMFANSKTANLFGADTPEALSGQSIARFISEDERQKIRSLVSEKTEASPCTYDTKIQALDSRETEVEVISYPLVYQNKLSYINIVKDLSSENKINELRSEIISSKELNEFQNEFFSNISHEFKTPLNVILASIQVLSISQANLGKNLGIMKQNCYRLLRLVNNLIDITRLDRGYASLMLRNIDVVSLVSEVVSSVEEYIKGRGLQISFEAQIQSKIIAIDSDKIERIILNLLSNAIKFTDKGGKIAVSLWEQHDKVCISVEDNGIGIPADKLHTILDRFSQVNKTLTRNSEGSGLGLSIVKKLVELHRGRLVVNSVLGEGSRFTVELPSVTVQESLVTEFYSTGETRIQRINIEFSDIYSKLSR